MKADDLQRILSDYRPVLLAMIMLLGGFGFGISISAVCLGGGGGGGDDEHGVHTWCSCSSFF